MGVNEQRAMGNKKPSQNWDDVRYFLAVARTGTLSAAAKQLSTEHTTVARHIQALEDELNNRLFHKSNSGYGLTDTGERLLAGAEAIESAYVSAKAAASSEGQPIVGTVRIGTPDGFGSVFLAPRVQLLTDRHPELEIEILTTTRPFSLLKREVDIAIAHSSPEQVRVVSRRLTDHWTYVYASRAYLNEAAPIAAREDLKKHPFIGFVEELLFPPEIGFSDVIGVEPRIRSRCRLRAPITCTFTKIIEKPRMSGRLRPSSRPKSSATILSSMHRRQSAPRLHILVDAEEVHWIILGLEFDRSSVIASKRRPDTLGLRAPRKFKQVGIA